MVHQAWSFDLEDGGHLVDLEHDPATGARTIRLDGEVLEQTAGLGEVWAHMGSKHPFHVGAHTGMAIIRTNGVTFDYSLLIDGTPVPLANSLLPAVAKATWASDGPTACGAQAPAPVLSSADATRVSDNALMLREIHRWGYWQLGLGAVHLIAPGLLSPTWGITLLLMGAASFLFADAAMFVLYGTTLAWVALANLCGGTGAWKGFALFQGYLACRVFWQYSRFRRVQAEYSALVAAGTVKDPQATRAAHSFPWLGCALGVLSLGGLEALFVTLVVVAGTHQALPALFPHLLDGDFSLAVLGLAISLGSLLSHHRPRFLAGLGAATSGLVMLVSIVLLMLSWLG